LQEKKEKGGARTERRVGEAGRQYPESKKRASRFQSGKRMKPGKMWFQTNPMEIRKKAGKRHERRKINYWF